jgi:hypothetical protein
MAKEPTPMPKSYEKFPLKNPLIAAPPPKKQQYHFETNDLKLEQINRKIDKVTNLVEEMRLI